MMYKNGVRIVAAAMVLLGCAANRPVIEIGGYDFDFEGETYRIASINPSSMVGYNILALKEGDQHVTMGLDKDQDGILDGVVEGVISLRKAREIYQAGIAEGERLGRVKSRVLTQEFITVINQYTYILVTSHLALGEVSNKLTVLAAPFAPEEAILLDLDADGRLDRIEKGRWDLEHYQDVYDQVIERGLMSGRVIQSGGKYLVVP